jgi:hypothetical protein
MWSRVCWKSVVVVVVCVCTAHAVLWISAVLALPELAAWLGGIAVLWTWTESFLLAVVLDEEEGEWD